MVEPINPQADCEPFEALAFISSPWQRLGTPVAPSRRYADLILGGAELRGLPEEYIEWLRRERDSARDGTEPVPSRYYATRGRAAQVAFATAWACGLIGVPLAQKVSQSHESQRGES